MAENFFLRRLITALVLAPLVILLIFFISKSVFAVGTAIIFLLAIHEWGQFFSRHSRFKTLLLQICFLGLIYFSVRYGYILSAGVMSTTTIAVISSASAFWLIAMTILFFFARGNLPKIADSFLFIIGLGIFFSVWLSWQVLFGIEPGHLIFIYLLLLVWIADSLAYLCGRRWGKRKLVPKISPGKTWEGLGGALLVSALFALLWSMSPKLMSLTVPLSTVNPPVQIFFWLAISLLVVFISVVGDIWISMLKRQSHLKDSGKLLPGHGGVLDRLDSLLAASPWFLLSLYCLGWLGYV